MKTIAVLTPEPSDIEFQGGWRRALEPLMPVLQAVAQVELIPWTRADGLRAFDLVLPLAAWSYFRRIDEWRSATSSWAADDVRIQNPAKILEWNADKHYLQDLAACGAPVIPSIFLERLTPGRLAKAIEGFGVEVVVAKPTVSGGAYQTVKLREGESLDKGPTGPALIQPYLPSIETEGEYSIIFFGGHYSHTVQKTPADGDYRVQIAHGGEVRSVTPPQDILEAARTVVAAVGTELLYARVDIVRDLDQRPALMELEAIEPELFIGHLVGDDLLRGALTRALSG